jgi:hypothetical protein
MLTFVMARYLLRISVFIPAPLMALALCTVLAQTIFAGKGNRGRLEKHSYGGD